MVTEYLGSLLSLYALTSDSMYLIRAVELADFLVPHYQEALSHKPHHYSKYTDLYYQWLESRYLADLMENRKYWNRAHSNESLQYVANYPYLCLAGLYLVEFLYTGWAYSF